MLVFLVVGSWWFLVGFYPKTSKLLVTQKKEKKNSFTTKLRVWNARGREREIEESLSYTHTHVYSFIAQRER